VTFLIYFIEKENYAAVQISSMHWYVVRTEVKTQADYPHLRPEGVPISFKGPPIFKEAHLVVLSGDDILTCSCGLKHRYGIPCRHLFSLEPEYDLSDIDFRYQVAYSYYAYHPDHRDVTRAYKARQSCEHNGIGRKSLKVETVVPHLITPSPLTVQQIVDIYKSKYPLCWNYLPREYSDSYRPPSQGMVRDLTGDFTQESTRCTYDSDGALASETSLHGDVDTNDEVDTGIAHEDSAANPSIREISRQSNMPVITDAQLLSKFKGVMNCHKSQTAKKVLWTILNEAERNQKKRLISENPALIGTGHQEFVSLHLPIDRTRESVQHAYQRSRIDRKRKKRKR
jgi:hypothetical protein